MNRIPLRVVSAVIATVGVLVANVAAGEFALRDGDRVVFLGDSITAARTYTKIIENYTLLRFPRQRFRFFNAGLGGDTATGALKRLERDVFSCNPTVLTVCFGLNDIGWGLHADDEHKVRYIDSLERIIRICQERKVRVFVCSGPVTAEDPDNSETGFLQTMCDEAFMMAHRNGAATIDVQRPMRDVQRRIVAVNKTISDKSKHVKLHLADGVHLNDLGHLAMAFAFLKGLDAPGEVSHAVIDAQSAVATMSTGCRISDIRVVDDGCSFKRLDDGLPFNSGLFYALNFLYVPMHREFNGYTICVSGLPTGTYTIVADGRSSKQATARQLAAGVDIASTTTDAWQPGGPWDVQATILKSLTDARHELDSARFLSRLYLPGHALVDELDRDVASAEDQIVELQRMAARPRTYQFEIRRKDDPPADALKATR
ncbi:MAG: SGNH/GDSL hydrolase family protein [Planctomycetes bacterium]|nr:SGNH/GDSL hydrolase family protein [Planctomycetota bacterium]